MSGGKVIFMKKNFPLTFRFRSFQSQFPLFWPTTFHGSFNWLFKLLQLIDELLGSGNFTWNATTTDVSSKGELPWSFPESWKTIQIPMSNQQYQSLSSLSKAQDKYYWLVREWVFLSRRVRGFRDENFWGSWLFVSPLFPRWSPYLILSR